MPKLNNKLRTPYEAIIQNHWYVCKTLYICAYPGREAVLGFRMLGEDRCPQIKTMQAQGAVESNHLLIGQGQKSPGSEVTMEST